MLETQCSEVTRAVYIRRRCRLHFLKPFPSILTIILLKLHFNIIFSSPSQYSKRMYRHYIALYINTAYVLFKRTALQPSNKHLLETHVLETYHDM